MQRSSPEILFLMATAALQACVSVPPRNPVPEELVEQAEVVDTSRARFWSDSLPVDLEDRKRRFAAQLAASSFLDGQDTVSLLLISGGGADGAFGAGLLKGWTTSGQRPEFLYVTGTGTGAFIAPYAFLGSSYDDELEALYTGMSTSDLVKRRSLLVGLTSDAMADTKPLRELMIKHVNSSMIDAIATEWLKGRRLLIGTTNIDTQRPVIWDISYIATIGTPEAEQLIRDVMLASVSIPGAFPPVRIAVEANGQGYDELHVDGGTTQQAFLYATPVDTREVAEYVGITQPITAYVIRNGRLEPRWSAVEPKLAPVLMAAVSTLVQTQGLGDLYRLYLTALRDGANFRLASVPTDFQVEREEMFDPNYMKALFDVGYEAAKGGYPWATYPPGIDIDVNPQSDSRTD